MKLADLQTKAKETLKRLNQKKKDQRFLKTIGKLKGAGILENKNIISYCGKLDLEDVLWAGQVEPRILEVLPATLLKKPNFIKYNKLPKDLDKVLQAIRKGGVAVEFRGVEPKLYMQWVERIGHKGKSPSILKTFRFTREDLRLLKELKQKKNLTEIEVIRQGLQSLHRELAK